MIRISTTSFAVVLLAKSMRRKYDCYGPYRNGVHYIYRKDRLPMGGIMSKFHQPNA